MFRRAGCSDITPEPNDEGGGVVDSPTNEADQMRQTEEQQEENQMKRWRRRRSPIARSPTPHDPDRVPADADPATYNSVAG